jgi:squalene-hopene/tetraprenyl-beta-curcumene cyclase
MTSEAIHEASFCDLLQAASFDALLSGTREALLQERLEGRHWEGRLATSALSTATSVIALHMVDAKQHESLIRGGLDWLAANINTDGGWGDTVLSRSNPNTTSLCWAALALQPEARDVWQKAEQRGAEWIRKHLGELDPASLVKNILAFYGRDRTFSTPICSVLALCGRLGPREEAFKRIPALPFEAAAAPQAMWRWLRLPVVSYALPALVAIGQVRFHYAKPWCPAKRALRSAVRPRTLRVVERMQPSSGGFLEAIPLTSFVTACLASIGLQDHSIVRNGVRFLLDMVRDDGGWPIDTCLSTWVTTLSVNALARNEALREQLRSADRKAILDWLLKQQYDYVHPFTNTPPGAWSWMDTDGAVPDADDTPGALLALRALDPSAERTREAGRRGVRWLLALQNRDGGVPTFCRGWSKLPFDRSAQDMTAHTVRAWRAWHPLLPPDLRREVDEAAKRALVFLENVQRADGSWVPLWFGNEHTVEQENPTYGTSRVLLALTGGPERDSHAARHGAAWLLTAQNEDGGWGGGSGTPSSLEETGCAIEALAHWGRTSTAADRGKALPAIARGVSWLNERTDGGRHFPPAPIGLYFAKLWYFERLYPVVFPLAALEAVAQLREAEAK